MSRRVGPAHGRLAAVSALVPTRVRVAEIGTDHARLALLLLRSGRVTHCIATDRSRAALERARRSIPHGLLADRLELRHGGGLGILRPSDDVQVLVMAGLGARSMLAILGSGDPQALGVRALVLQPQSEPALLRRRLVERGLLIADETMARERGRFYVALRAEFAGGPTDLSHPTLSEQEMLEVGPALVRARDPVAQRLWSMRARELSQALGQAKDEASRARLHRRLQRARRAAAALGARSGSLL